MIYNIFTLIKLALLVSKSLFAIYQKRIFFHFAAFGDHNFCSMSVRGTSQAGNMAARELVIVVSQNYENWTVQNL